MMTSKLQQEVFRVYSKQRGTGNTRYQFLKYCVSPSGTDLPDFNAAQTGACFGSLAYTMSNEAKDKTRYLWAAFPDYASSYMPEEWSDLWLNDCYKNLSKIVPIERFYIEDLGEMKNGAGYNLNFKGKRWAVVTMDLSKVPGFILLGAMNSFKQICEDPKKIALYYLMKNERKDMEFYQRFMATHCFGLPGNEYLFWGAHEPICGPAVFTLKGATLSALPKQWKKFEQRPYLEYKNFFSGDWLKDRKEYNFKCSSNYAWIPEDNLIKDIDFYRHRAEHQYFPEASKSITYSDAAVDYYMSDDVKKDFRTWEGLTVNPRRA